MKGKLIQNEPMARHTTFRIGGNADLFFIPEDEEDLKRGLQFARSENLPWFILGNGSDILVSDSGIRGMVIHLSSPFFRKLTFEGNALIARAGAKTGTVLHECAERDLGGVEFLGAIPGTMGGVFFMNGGTYLGDISGVTRSVTFLDESLERRTLQKRDLKFTYRKSIFQEKPWVILEGCLDLVATPKSEAKSKVAEILKRRRETQPLSLASAGSAFKNPIGQSAWKLIEASNLRGFEIGDAVVSDTHTNFIINRGTAKASDVLALFRMIQEKVREKTGILLEPEVRLVGDWPPGERFM